MKKRNQGNMAAQRNWEIDSSCQ